MRLKTLLKTMLLLCALVAGSGSAWADTYQQLTSIADIDESAQYVLGIDGTGFHYEGTSSWGYIALPSNQTPLYYTLKKGDGNTSFTAKTTISNTIYYLTVPTSKTFTMSTSSTNIGMGDGGRISNLSSTGWIIRVNTNLRAYNTSTGSIAYFYKVIPAFTLTATSNNESYGTVSVSGNVITGSPKTGYRYASPAYTVTSGTATVSQSGNTFTVTASAACTVQINFEEIPKYTVTFNAEGGSCSKTSLEESVGGQGVTLPTATTDVSGWEFAGWSESTVSNTTTIPTLYKAGSTYYPTAATTLHAVYTLSETGTNYTRVTSLSQIPFAKKIAVVSNRSTSKILTHDASGVNAPSEDNGEITVQTNQIFAISGDNTNGFVFTGASGTLSQATLSTSSNTEVAVDWTGTNNLWIIEDNTNTTNVFTVRNAESDKASLEYDGGWKTYYVSTYLSSTYTAMRLYIPKTAYNSNPSAIVTPTVAFNSKTPVTLYLDGTKTNTNTATVTNVNKTINYSSSNTSVATVPSAGVVTAVGIGTATITASVDAELGVSASAFDTYEVTVKSTTTIAGIKAITNGSSVVTFTADLTDAVVTYVNGSHAYIQDASGAVYASCGSSLTAGKKINGTVSGSVKASYQIDEITAIDLTAATLSDSDIPAAEVKTLAEIKAAPANYDGKLVKIVGATINTGMNNVSSGGVITDDNGTTKFNIIAPNKLTLVANEKGNFTGFVSIYNGSTYRLNIYETSQFVKTHNAPQNQTLSFEGGNVVLDEETAQYDAFEAKTVSGAQGTVTYSITGDAIYSNFNATTGAFTLNGSYGTATITATAAATDVTDANTGIITPYNEATTSYTVTVNPRYQVTFVVNGTATQIRQENSGATISVPTPATVAGYTFVGWSTAEVSVTDDEPNTMTTLAATITPTANGTYYAVYAIQTVGADETVIFYNNTGSTGADATTGITASGNINRNNGNGGGDCFGLTSETNKTATFTGINLSSVTSATLSFDYKLAKSGSSYSSLTVTQYNSSNATIGSAATITGSDQSYHTTSAITLDKSCVKVTIVCTPAASTYNTFVDNLTINVTRPGITYVGYRTSLPTATITLASACTDGKGKYYGTYSSSSAFVVSSDITVSEISVIGGELLVENYEAGAVVPANTGVMVSSTTSGAHTVIVTTGGTSVLGDNNMLKPSGDEGITAANMTVDNTKFYRLTMHNGNTIGFWWGAENGAAFALAANKAYLAVPNSAAGARMGLWFGDDATAIENVNHNNTLNGEAFDLQGRRVATPQKGLYIVNGKKVVIK